MLEPRSRRRRPIALAAAVALVISVPGAGARAIAIDGDFENGSGIELTSLTPQEADNLTMLGRVWGFLKYHHPAVARGGGFRWDFELLRMMPEMLEAPNGRKANRALTRWLNRIGAPEPCSPCAPPPIGAQLRPDIDWIRDVKLLSRGLSRRLVDVYVNRHPGGQQRHISKSEIGHVLFLDEPDYAHLGMLPDAGYRMLAAMRLWNAIEYWFPYRDQLDDDWPTALREFLPRIVEADTPDGYRLEMMAFIARVGDTHANLWSDLQVRPPRGDCRWPVAFRFIEGRPTVVAYADELQGRGAGLRIGDVLLEIDGESVDDLIDEWLPYYAASNRPTQLRDLARGLPRGDCGGEVEITIDRRGRSRKRTVPYLPSLPQQRFTHDREGDTFQLLAPEVGYLKLSTVRISEVDSYLESARDTEGLVIDIRNYPQEFVVFALGNRLVFTPTAFVRFTTHDLGNPGLFRWGPRIRLNPTSPQYGGKIAILVDEVTVSQSEYTTMAFRSAARAVVVGSTTAGADGNVSPIGLPGGLRTQISGLGVFYPDGSPTQRIGIVPDVYVEPTRQGVIEGRDEVLEEALRQILGGSVSEAALREMAAWP